MIPVDYFDVAVTTMAPDWMGSAGMDVVAELEGRRPSLVASANPTEETASEEADEARNAGPRSGASVPDRRATDAGRRSARRMIDVEQEPPGRSEWLITIGSELGSRSRGLGGEKFRTVRMQPSSKAGRWRGARQGRATHGARSSTAVPTCW